MKQRVLIVTKFYYRRGGDCIYALNLERMLREHGHEVAVFAMWFGENEHSEWSEYWPSEVDFGGGAAAKIAAVKRMLGMGDVKARFARILEAFRPDVVHLNNIHSYLSPVVGRMAKNFGARVVWTLHDYKLLCPAYSCLRQGQTCELCFNGKFPVLSRRCMKDSLAASGMAFLEALRWNRRELEKDTDVFICPSSFMASKMKQGNFDAGKLTTLCNFIAPDMAGEYAKVPAIANPDEYYCYIGRLSEEKGVETLLAAAAALPYKIKVAGDGPLADKLRERYMKNGNIEFLGRIDAVRVHELLIHARMSVMPSECYENNPLSVIESFCAGTPVVGAAIGGIPELVTADRGITFESGNRKSLADAVRRAWAASFDRQAIQRKALAEFAPEAYYRKLLNLYGGILL